MDEDCALDGEMSLIDPIFDSLDADTLGESETRLEADSLAPGTSGEHPPPQLPAAQHTTADRFIADEGPPAKVARTGERADVSDRDEDGEVCSICLDSWTNSGPHRLVCLKCGHLFGYDCVVRWLKSLPMKQRVCPTCKTKATLRDIRHVYARRLVAVDNGEVDELRAQLERARADRVRAEQEVQHSRLSVDSTKAELERLRALMQGKPGPAPGPPVASTCWRLSLERTLILAGDGSCRVLAYNCRKQELYASHRSFSSLFPGFGVRKIDCATQQSGKFLHLHRLAIRDIEYSAEHDLTLSVSHDRTARLTCGKTEQAVATIRSERQLWSCCWSGASHSQLLVGGEGGTCLVYDARNTAEPLQRLIAPDNSPVVSAASTPHGYLVAHLNSCRLYKTTAGPEVEPITLPIEGPFLSLRYDRLSNQMLVSCRPCVAHRCSRNVLASVSDAGCRVLHTRAGSAKQTLMSRSCLLRLGGEVYAAAHVESEGVVELFGGDNFRQLQRIPVKELVVDMQGIDVAGVTVLATLFNKKLRLYNANLFGDPPAGNIVAHT